MPRVIGVSKTSQPPPCVRFMSCASFVTMAKERWPTILQSQTTSCCHTSSRLTKMDVRTAAPLSSPQTKRTAGSSLHHVNIWYVTVVCPSVVMWIVLVCFVQGEKITQLEVYHRLRTRQYLLRSLNVWNGQRSSKSCWLTSERIQQKNGRIIPYLNFTSAKQLSVSSFLLGEKPQNLRHSFYKSRVLSLILFMAV